MKDLNVMGFLGPKALKLGAVILAVLCLAALFWKPSTSLGDQELWSNLTYFCLGLAYWLAVWQSSLLSQSWSRAARVLRARSAPSALWRQWMRESLIIACRMWAVLAILVVAVLWPARVPWHGIAATALLVVVVCGSLLTAMARKGFVHKAWNYATLLIFVYPVSLYFAGGFFDSLQFLNAAPWWVLLAICLAVPGLLVRLWQRWSSGPPAEVEVATAKGLALTSVFKRIKAWAARYTVLEGMSRDFSGRTVKPQGALLRSMFLPVIFFVNGSILGQPLGSTVTGLQVWMTGFLMLVMCGNLVCKDLHWRMLLAPGGMHQGHLGWRIALSTATVYAVGAAALVIPVLGVTWVVSNRGFELALNFVVKFVALPFILVFAIAVATLIRGTHYPWRWFFAVMVVWLMAGVGIYWGMGSSMELKASTPMATVNLPYLLSFLALAAPALWAANKLWTVDRLMQCAPR